MTNKQTTNRVNNAITLFEKGYNCSQAVFMAYADLYDIEQETAAKIATSFGGGMGRLREVCGAASGMFLVLGLHYPFTDINDKTAKNNNYQAVQRLANHFKAEMGSYICADLLQKKREPESSISDNRTDKYYAERPCTKCVRIAAEIVGKEILASR
jgi:C_GCAxxG_C_C family probable redox protein